MSEMYRALYDYTSAQKHVLSFKSGVLFTVLNKSGGVWWSVQTEDGQTGMVPSSYLVKDEVCEPWVELLTRLVSQLCVICFVMNVVGRHL